MYYNFKDLPKEYKNTEVELWAFDYATNNTEKSMGLKAKPYKCKFKTWSSGEVKAGDDCCKVKNNGEIASSGRVRADSRRYALTEQEAIDGYNELVDELVGFLVRMAKVYESDKIGG